MIHGAFNVARALAFPRAPGEDRAGVYLTRAGALVVVVADGAGGLFGGARAADILVELVAGVAASPALDPLDPERWVDVLASADPLVEADREAGETTAVVMAIAGGLVAGASCGDSGAWVVQADARIDDLTAQQHRKHRLGSGRADPVPFSRPATTTTTTTKLAGTLVVGSDGLFGYARRERLAAVALQDDLDEAARALVELVRLPGGGLQDDVAVVLVRELGHIAHHERHRDLLLH